MNTEEVMRGLIKVWTDFETSLDNTPLIDKLNRGKFRLEDYKTLLINHRQQVVEGTRWISRASSSIDGQYLEHRSMFLKHAITEHRDYQMLEDNYISLGGTLEEIRNAEKNIGTEALHGYMFHNASQPNPFNLLGSMFIIEGLGQKKAGVWGAEIQRQLNLEEKQVSFLLYHSKHDEEHMDEFHEVLDSGILEIPELGSRIIKTAKVTARLYQLQIEELGNV
ncbi:MAG: iron-containing redox enzyme family protein [Alphaproteobacteria bacterium]|nr:iron-containing redox enzyme family protein [Alphaproteobacteria bacterium]